MHTDSQNKAFQDAFGPTPSGFARRVETTVQRMERTKAKAVKPRMIPLIALTLVLLAGVALALSSLGLLDRLTEPLRENLQPGAEQLIQQDIAQQGGKLDHATFAVTEAIYDGRQVYFTVRVSANDPKATLLMDQDAVPSNGRDWWIAYDWNAGETYSSLASSTGRELMQASARVASGDISASNVAYDGEDILYTMSMPVAEGGPQAQVALDINTFTYYRDDLTHAERLSSGTLTFTVPATDARTIYAAKTPIDLPLAGMTLTEATLELTPIATYLTCAYSLNEDATDLQGLNMHDGLWPRWLDADGNALADGQTQQSMDTSTDEVRLITSYPAMETAPEEITIEFFNGMTKERFDAPTLTLSKQEGETK